jgi:LysR family transcriptional regulator for bpeEF and oprC
MDKIKAMEAFVRVVDAGGFTRAAELLQAPKATISTLVQDLEAQLGVRLLHRTTRRVTVTADGAAFYERCVRILDDVREAEDSVSVRQSSPSGRLRVDVATAMASHMLIPALPDFIKRYPDIRLELGCGDRPINLTTEGVDCAIRTGDVNDPSLIARRIGSMKFVVCAAPRYLAEHGVPLHPEELRQHRCLNYFFQHNGRISAWDFSYNGEALEMTFDSPLALNDSNAYIDACLAGLGIAQLPCFVFYPHQVSGQLVEMLNEWQAEQAPVHVIYPATRHLSTKVRVFVEWVAETFEGYPGLVPN